MRFRRGLAVTALTTFAALSSRKALAQNVEQQPVIPGPAPVAAQPVAHAPKKPVWHPTWGSREKGEIATVGQPLVIDLRATGEEGDQLVFSGEGLPGSARVDAPMFPYPAKLRWTPDPEDVGFHEMTLFVSDGVNRVPALLRVTVKPIAVASPQQQEKIDARRNDVESDWTTFLMPGVGAVVVAPADRHQFGMFAGGTMEFLLGAWIHSNENRGPSHGRVYMDLDILHSSNDALGTALNVSIGVDLSLERNPKRRFLIPFYGLQTGAIVDKAFDPGGIGHVTPLAGIHLYADRNVFVVASAGYLLPLSAQYFDTLRAFRGTLGFDISFW